MVDKDQDAVLRDMARNRGLRLVKSRRRKRGGDRGKYGLADPETGKPVFGFGETGLTADASEIEAHLRAIDASAWKKSAGAQRPAARAKVVAAT